MKTFTVQLTERELEDLRDALPKGRPAPSNDFGRTQRLWDLDDKLKRLQPDR